MPTTINNTTSTKTATTTTNTIIPTMGRFRPALVDA
eukprot:CAMPEP_0174852506 /NCGR_PEP_ID=MMETSP1114-20130205/25669_1 /TAXON_ID=312471 /ORGANISM="Neobodo designis, Strain CCAP 1951/1" /LENGTH=35 /DNA_ID= /DNA_START= /DNA_END= /DNA_ORIENTATION=